MKQVHILLVEDNEGDILLTTEALSEKRMINSVDVVRDGWEAIRYLEKKDNYREVKIPDIILLDINLPKLNGQEVLRNIKKNPDLLHIPVIMLTTSSNVKDISESYNNHVNCYITKPVEANRFQQVLSSIENFWINTAQLP